MKVPYVNMAAQHSPLRQEILRAVGSVIDHGQFVLGPEVEEFEEGFAELCGVSHAVGVNSGTDALILALRALGIGSGDEVITVPNSFVATASAIALVGARPVFVDVGADYNMDVRKLPHAITPRTKAVLPVHLTGRPADMDPILHITHERGLAVIEDAAQAVLAQYRGHCVGSLGTVGCFSFHPLKTLNACGDGGGLTTNDSSLYERLKILRNLGLKTRENCLEWSGNSRLDGIQAAIMMVKMKYLKDWTEKRRENAAYYRKYLADISELELPLERSFEKPVYHTFVIQAERRDELKRFLGERGVGTAIHYPVPIHLQEAAASLGYGRGSFPEAERQSRRILSLPIHQDLGADEIEYVIQSIRAFYCSRE